MMKILTAHREETLTYAAEELKKYILGMSRGEINPEIRYVDSVSESNFEEGIVLGFLGELSLDTSDLEDDFIEDIIDVNVKACKGYIAGSNPRSILMGVYRYCASAGCQYLRPGADGDYVPHADLINHSFKYRKKADQPFRGEITEGAFSYEHARDVVYYLPKIGMNAFMIEGTVPYTYMHKWYGHVANTKLRRKGQRTDYGMLQKYMGLLERDVKRAGLQLHTLGHDWMFRKMGTGKDIPAQEQDSYLTDDKRELLALLNGKRGINRDVFYTNFCYTNPKARQILVDTVVEYAESHKHVDYVHLWLADAANNWCECEECRKTEPSDQYITLLNEIDGALTEKGLDTRLVLIMYVETIRPPRFNRLKNPERFCMTVAIGSHYEEGYKKLECNEELPPYKINDWKLFSAPLLFKCHDDWKKICNGLKSTVFEYRFYIDQYCDLGHMQLSRETHRDMKNLDVVNFNGCLSDKTPRMYMPTALPMIMLGETMFDKNLDFDKRADEYFEGAFGADGAKCREYLEALSKLLSPSNFRVDSDLGIEEMGIGNVVTNRSCWKNNPEVAGRAREIPALLDSFLPIIRDNIAYADDDARRLSWRYLEYHSEIVRRFSEVLLSGALGDTEKAAEACYNLENYISEHELEFHPVFDLFLFSRYVRLKLGLPRVPYYD